MASELRINETSHEKPSIKFNEINMQIVLKGFQLLMKIKINANN